MHECVYIFLCSSSNVKASVTEELFWIRPVSSTQSLLFDAVVACCHRNCKVVKRCSQIAGWICTKSLTLSPIVNDPHILLQHRMEESRISKQTNYLILYYLWFLTTLQLSNLSSVIRVAVSHSCKPLNWLRFHQTLSTVEHLARFYLLIFTIWNCLEAKSHKLKVLSPAVCLSELHSPLLVYVAGNAYTYHLFMPCLTSAACTLGHCCHTGYSNTQDRHQNT